MPLECHTTARVVDRKTPNLRRQIHVLDRDDEIVRIRGTPRHTTAKNVAATRAGAAKRADARILEQKAYGDDDILEMHNDDICDDTHANSPECCQ